MINDSAEGLTTWLSRRMINDSAEGLTTWLRSRRKIDISAEGERESGRPGGALYDFINPNHDVDVRLSAEAASHVWDRVNVQFIS